MHKILFSRKKTSRKQPKFRIIPLLNRRCKKYCEDEYHCYLGFSLGNGHLWGPGKGLQMVSGMPRARSRGMVVVYQRTNSSSSEARRLDPQDPGLGSLRMLNESIEPMLYLEGEAYGESFGYSLVVLDLNGDGRDDVVVGAPYFQDNGSGRGRGCGLWISELGELGKLTIDTKSLVHRPTTTSKWSQNINEPILRVCCFGSVFDWSIATLIQPRSRYIAAHAHAPSRCAPISA